MKAIVWLTRELYRLALRVDYFYWCAVHRTPRNRDEAAVWLASLEQKLKAMITL